MRSLRNSKGFTLIELMIVVVIIGILAAIAIPKFSSVSKTAKEAEAGPILKQMCTLVATYKDQYGATPALTDLTKVGWDAATAGKYYGFTLPGGVPTASPNTAGTAAGVKTQTMDCATGVIS